MARTSPAEFFRQVRQEVSRVTWPTRKELTITTAMVFVMAFVVAIFFFFVDSILAFGVKQVLGLGG
ncbi:MAG TPA: preprotein translocase subunit SecE [Stellaceae bacterium]|nr:preprotein translocase subunit SecE [Stellaceae bacterium]